MASNGWIGVDLDGTLAHYEGFKGPDVIGEPVPLMLERVKNWLAEGKDVRIFTARVYGVHEQRREALVAYHAITKWCEQHIGQALAITCVKDYGMVQLWDDRCVQVIPNTGRAVGELQ